MIVLAIGLSALVCVAVFVATWLLSLRLGRVNIVDTVWGLGFLSVAITSFVLSSGHGDLTIRCLVLVLVAVWALRLSIYIGLRSRGHGEDPRYVEFMNRATGSRSGYALTHIFLLQAASAWFVSLPIQVVMFQARGNFALVYVGAVMWLVGFGFEAIGDAQLARFKKDPANRGKLMTTGLWRYTRHPNYFGEACLWFGFFVIATQHWSGLLTIASPILMTYFVVAKTGKPMLEQQLARTKPGYAQYLATTSGFLPRRPRTGN